LRYFIYTSLPPGSAMIGCASKGFEWVDRPGKCRLRRILP